MYKLVRGLSVFRTLTLFVTRSAMLRPIALLSSAFFFGIVGSVVLRDSSELGPDASFDFIVVGCEMLH